MADIWKKFKSYAAGAGGSALSSFIPGLKNYQPLVAAGAGALANRDSALKGAFQGAVGGAVGSGLMGGASGLFGQQGGSAMDNFWAGGKQGLTGYMGQLPGMKGFGTGSPTGAFAKWFSPQSGGSSTDDILKRGTSYYKPNAAGGYSPTGITPRTSGAVGSPVSSIVAGGPGEAMNPMDMFRKMMPGAGVSLAGSLLAPTPDAPDYSGVRNEFQKQVEQGGNPAARKAAMDYYFSTLQAPTGASAEAAIANARLINDRQREEAQRAIDQQFQANQGGANFANSSEYQTATAKNKAYYDQNYAAQAAQTQFLYDQQQQQYKQAAAQALAGMDDAQLQYYAGLAGLDIMQLQDQFALDAGEAQAIKDIASMAGQMMMEKGLGLDQVRRAA